MKLDARTPEEQRAVLAALKFKCDVSGRCSMRCVMPTWSQERADRRVRATGGSVTERQAEPRSLDAPELARGVGLRHNEVQRRLGVART